MNHSHTFVAHLLICAMSIGIGCIGENALAAEKNLIVTIPAPMSELTKNNLAKTKVDISRYGLAANYDCQKNDLFLQEAREDYAKRIASIKFKKANFSCDARFAINHIKGQADVPFHHMNVDAGLDAAPIDEWLNINDNGSAYFATFVSTPFSFETMGAANELGQLYARRIWKVSVGLGQQNIGKIVLNKSKENAAIVDAVVSELNSPAGKKFLEDNYRGIANKIEINDSSKTSDAALVPSDIVKISQGLNGHIEQTDEVSKANILVINALHNYFQQFQRVDFSSDSDPEKILKSVNNVVKTVQLLKNVRQIAKDHPEALKSFNKVLIGKITEIFSPSQTAIDNDAEVDRLARLMSALPNILLNGDECRDLTGILVNVIQGKGESLSGLNLEELAMNSMSALSPIISEMAIESINNVVGPAESKIGQQIATAKNRFYTTKELNRIFFDGVELSSQDSLKGVFTEINTVFARLKEFYLRAYDGILLIDAQAQKPRTPASEGIIEQYVQAPNCPVQKYSVITSAHGTTDLEVQLGQQVDNTGIAIPVTNVHAEPLDSDKVKAAIEKQLTAAAGSLPMIMATSGGGQLEQLLAVISQQSVSLVDILKNTTFNGHSNFYTQIILMPTNTYERKKALSGMDYVLPTEKLLPQNGDPLCDARNVVVVVDYLYKSDGTINFNIQWGLQLPRQFSQPLSEFTGDRRGFVATNSPGKPDQVHISHFQLLTPKGKDLSHFALFTLSGSGRGGLNKVNANIKFGPQMSLRINPDYMPRNSKDIAQKANVFLHTPEYADIFNGDFVFKGKLKNSDTPPFEIVWSVVRSLGQKIWKTNVCSENATFGPIVNLNKAYPQPLQAAFNKLGLYDVFLHSGKARVDEIGLEFSIDPTQVSSASYTPVVKLNKFDLQVFAYNLDGKYYSDRDQFHLLDDKASGKNGDKLMLNLGDWVCFPLPHNKEIQIMNGISESLNAKMPDIWGRARNIINQVKSIMGQVKIAPTGDVERINTDINPEN
ncbi:MAG: hypothetical protein ACXVCP_09170 [Bdellovibrio sp.]